MTRPIISLGDAIRCQAELGTSGAATTAMLRMLGLEVLASALERDPDGVREEIGRLTPALRGRGSGTGVGSSEREDTAQQHDASAANVTRPASPTPAPSVTREPAFGHETRLPTQLRPLEKLSLSTTGVLRGGVPLASAAAGSPPPSPSPLFPTVQRRAILTAAIASSVPEGRLDVDAIIRAAVRRSPLVRLPHLRRSTIRRGLQLLVDRGAALAPFWRDEDMLVAHLQELLGRGRLELFEFWGFPKILEPSGDAEDDRAPRWRPPRSGTPVLIVSDFSIGTRTDSEQWVPTSRWHQFAAAVMAQGSAVVGLIPYAPLRWPAGLPRRIACIPWSERTTAGAVRRTIRRLRTGTR